MLILSSGAEGAPDARYERRRLYSMDASWSADGGFDPAASLVRLAPLGGPIAIMAKPNVPRRASDHRMPAREIAVYSASGKSLCVWSYERWASLRFVAAGWTAREEFLTLFGDGTLLIWSLFRTEPAVRRTLVATAEAADLEDAVVWSGGLLLLKAMAAAPPGKRLIEVALAMDVHSGQGAANLRLLARVTMERSEIITCTAVVCADAAEGATRGAQWTLLRPTAASAEVMISTSAKLVHIVRKVCLRCFLLFIFVL